MLNPSHKLVIYAEGSMGTLFSKMAEGVLRYSQNPIVAVIDSKKAGKTVRQVCKIDKDIPIFAEVQSAISLGAQVMVLGTAPSGGRLPKSWLEMLEYAISKGISIVNGLHDSVYDLYEKELKHDQWIWDIRKPIGDPPIIGAARASKLLNKRVLMIGTDMAVGKMTAGLELTKSLLDLNIDAKFLATGQTGICISGAGIPLDAFKVDHASGAVEEMVLKHKKTDVVVIEGQGSLLNPGSTATLPLMRGSCPNNMILCHRFGLERVESETEVNIPPLKEVIHLNESLVSSLGLFSSAKVMGIALDTRKLDAKMAKSELQRIEDELSLPATDPVRFGSKKLADAII